MNATIKAKTVTKEVKLPRDSYDYRHHGKTHRTEKTVSVTATGLDKHERMLLVNMGELKEIIAGLRMLQQARGILTPNEWDLRRGQRLIDELEAASLQQPGLVVEEKKE